MQLLLLQAALHPEPAASEAANLWLSANRNSAADGFRYLESASRRLLPLVYQNLKHDSIPAGMRGQLKFVYCQYWMENQRVFRKLEAMLARLHAAGIPTLVLKGAALSILHYQDMGTRPMSDFDIVVPEERGPALASQFLSEGWTPDCIPRTAPYNDYFYRFRHALDLTHPEHGNLDLHWHALLEATFKGADRHFWAGSVPLVVRSIMTRSLNPSDQLLHTCLHGYAFNLVPSIRWIADAMKIIRTSTIDWERLFRVASDLRVTIPCAETLAFLNGEFDAGVPSAVISQLADHPVSAAERRFFRRMADPGARRWWETLEDVWIAESRANCDRSFLNRLILFPRHLQFEQQLSSLASLIPHTFVFLKRRFA